MALQQGAWLAAQQPHPDDEMSDDEMSQASRVPYSQLPGRHERHFRRRLNNALMPRPLQGHTDDELLEVQRQDHEELVAFIEQLKLLIVQAIELPANADSETVLAIKEQLDKAYETSAGLADEQTANQAAIADLINVIMQVVQRHAQGDSLAAEELAQEQAARRAHFELLKQPLVADILHPDSLIGADELLPVLLTESEEAFTAALELFDASQLGELIAQAGTLLADHAQPSWQARNALMQQRLMDLSPGAVN